MNASLPIRMDAFKKEFQFSWLEHLTQWMQIRLFNITRIILISIIISISKLCKIGCDTYHVENWVEKNVVVEHDVCDPNFRKFVDRNRICWSQMLCCKFYIRPSVWKQANNRNSTCSNLSYLETSPKISDSNVSDTLKREALRGVSSVSISFSMFEIQPWFKMWKLSKESFESILNILVNT